MVETRLSCHSLKRVDVFLLLQPENVLIASDWTVRLCDFGLAVDTSIDTPVSRVGTLVRWTDPVKVRLTMIVCGHAYEV